MTVSLESSFSKETINWSEEISNEDKSRKPQAKLKRLFETLREAITEKTVCAMFCGGKKCKYEGVSYWSSKEMELNGLFSNWITENIIAISRPNPTAILTYKLIDQFKTANIRAIINLQRPGEHASCGEGLHASGFSYNPQDFMDAGIFYYNFGWDDYNVGSQQNILDMTKVLQFALTEGKIAIHCHAGLGRTGVLICCYLIYANRMSANEAINFVRSKRPGSVQTNKQINCIQDFDCFLQPLRIVFSVLGGTGHTHAFTLDQYLNRQRHILHGEQARQLRYLPNLIYVTVNQMLNVVNRSSTKLIDRRPNNKNISQTIRNTIRKNSNGSMGLKRSMSTTLYKRPNKVGRKWLSHERLQEEHESTQMSSESSDNLLTAISEHKDEYTKPTDCSSVVEALLLDEYPAELEERARDFEQSLNEDWDKWIEFSSFQDPKFLSLLLWRWIDNLREPILLQQDLQKLLINKSHPKLLLGKLKKSTARVIAFFAITIHLLEPIDLEKRNRVEVKIMSVLTQTNVCGASDDSVSNNNIENFKCGKYARTLSDEKTRNITKFFRTLVESIE